MEFSYGHIGRDRSFPYLPIGSWLQALDKFGKLPDLIGCRGDFSSHLESFWAKYKRFHPTHQVYESGINLGQALPIYIHGDEGTTYKKDGALVISWQCPFGKGTSKHKMGDVLDEDAQFLNYVGHAFETRFLIIAALKDIMSTTNFILGFLCPVFRLNSISICAWL